MNESKADDWTIEPLFNGRMSCAQPRHGYRYGIDPLLLAHFMVPAPYLEAVPRILDLGAGCGIISLLLAHRFPQARITALEIQPSFVELLNYNIRLNNLGARVEVLAGDLRRIDEILAVGDCDLVYCNPPFGKRQACRTGRNEQQAVARHEMAADLEDIVRACAFALRPGGRAALIYPVGRRTELLARLRAAGLQPLRTRLVQGHPGSPARLILVEAVKTSDEGLPPVELPPMIIKSSRQGPDTLEVAGYYKP